MSRFLFVWELGEGLGHVTIQRPLAVALAEQGHEVVIAARNVRATWTAFADTGISFIQAPYQTWPEPPQFHPIRSYAHVLHASAFNDAGGLDPLILSWRTLVELVNPNAIVFDHSPTALLAARASAARRILLGTGFSVPPPTEPLPPLRLTDPMSPDALQQDEDDILSITNSALERTGIRPLGALADIYGEVDLSLLATYPELDHFGPRPDVRYWGRVGSMPAADPTWPDAPGKKIFCYLKPSRGVDELLFALRKFRQPTLVFGTWVNEQARSRFGSDTLKLESRPLDIRAVADQADLAILNATHGSTADFLLRGVPALQIPLHVEQALTAENTVRLGAGLAANLKEPRAVVAHVDRMLRTDEFRHGAARFADKYSQSGAVGTLEEMVELVTSMLA